ncbi:MAG: trigger factor [Bdellovibrionales bacterium RIFOXYD1_FULL_53_11]|nr:MAG: trigger factor [Bdellovibrionales bacterium RIFOXYD1_FULL_53_11]
MEFSVQMEKPSNIVRKLTIKVPAKVISGRFERGLADVQRKAKLKGFRPGQAPLSIIKQYYGDDVRHQLYHDLIDEAVNEAVREQKLRAVGSPRVEVAGAKGGNGHEGHVLNENEDLNFVATVEIMPEVNIKHYTGFSLKKEIAEVKDTDVEKVVEALRDEQAELVPATGGLALADGSMSSRPAEMKDHVEIKFQGGIVADDGTVEEKAGMKGERVVEIGSGVLIPGFEDQLVGMRKGDTKTFAIKFPESFHDKSMAGKDAQFTVTLGEVKLKKLPELDDEFAKAAGYESVSDLRAKARGFLEHERNDESERKFRSDLLQTLIDKNPFDVPASLIMAQARAIAQDLGQDLKKQGMDEKMVEETLSGQFEHIKKRADNQVRASLLLEQVAKQENIEVKDDEITAEITRLAASMKVDEAKLKEFYDKNEDRRGNLAFRMLEDKVVRYITENSKVKQG